MNLQIQYKITENLSGSAKSSDQVPRTTRVNRAAAPQATYISIALNTVIFIMGNASLFEASSSWQCCTDSKLLLALRLSSNAETGLSRYGSKPTCRSCDPSSTSYSVSSPPSQTVLLHSHIPGEYLLYWLVHLSQRDCRSPWPCYYICHTVSSDTTAKGLRHKQSSQQCNTGSFWV